MWRSVTEYFRLVMEGRKRNGAARVIRSILSPLSVLYGVCHVIVKWFDFLPFVQKRLPVPVVSVGNLTWGGTGKTPLVEKIAQDLLAWNKQVTILRRGYGEDETLLLSKHLPGVQVVVGKNRYQAGMRAFQKEPYDVALLDDGFQQWALRRDVDIVSINALSPYGNRRLLPAGILREPLSALERADIVVITHGHELTSYALEQLKMSIRHYVSGDAEIYISSFQPLDFYRESSEETLSLESMRGKRVIAYTAVGNPISFWKFLSKLGLNVVQRFEYRDHHKLTRGEIARIKKEKIRRGVHEVITTEKDFLRQPSDLVTAFDPLILRIKLRLEDEERFRKKIFTLLSS